MQPPPPSGATAPAASDARVKRIAFYSDNGHGLGHITRLMAIARRLAPTTVPVFLTMSESHDLVRRMGFAVEYMASPRKLGLNRMDWDELFHLRLERFIETFRPAAIVIDHVNPPKVFDRVAADHPEVALVWSRRGLWSDDRNRRALLLHDVMDLVIEPMDVASPFDRGDTIQFWDVARVPPITFLDRAELVDRAAARRELGLPEHGAAVLLQLSADDPGALRSIIMQARDLLRAVDPDVAVYAPLHVLHQHALEPVDGVRMTPVYPVSRYLAAFDGAMSTSGYNSFHELVMAATPTVFVERNTNSLDDQGLRAEIAARCGAALHLPTLDGSAASRAAATTLLDPDARERMRAAAGALYPGNGAGPAADAIERLTDAHPRTMPAPAPTVGPDPHQHRRKLARRRFTSGPLLDEEAREEACRVLVVAYGLDDAGLEELARDLLELQTRRSDVKPIVLVHAGATLPLSRDGWQYETVVTHDRWEALDLECEHADYLAERLEASVRLYDPAVVLTVGPGQPLRADDLPPPAAAPPRPGDTPG